MVEATREGDREGTAQAEEIAGASALPSLRARQSTSLLVESFALPAFWVILIVVFSLMEPDTYPTTANFANVFGSNSVLLLVSLAVLIPLIIGEFDLSIGANVGLAGMVIALLNAHHQVPIPLACVVGVLIAMVVGLLNAVFIVGFETDTIIVTLASGTIVSGVVYWISGANTVSGLSLSISEWTFLHTLFGIPVEFYYGLVVLAVLWYFYRLTPLGEQALCVGQSRRVAKLSGIRVSRHRTGGFVLAGLLAGLAGILMVGTNGAADPTTGPTLLLPAFAGAFLGSTAVLPGRFNPLGAGIAVFFLASGVSGLQLLGATIYVQDVFYGAALLIAVTVGTLLRRQREGRAS